MSECREFGAPVSAALEQNIETVMGRRARDMAEAGAVERIAARVSAFLGSMWSVAVHAAVFGTWILINLGWVSSVPAWDPTFVVLGMVSSVEAIFLTTFVLINQNRLAREEEDRSELALQVALLAERETTRLIELAARMAERLDVPVSEPKEVEDLAGVTEPAQVLDAIRRRKPEPL